MESQNVLTQLQEQKEEFIQRITDNFTKLGKEKKEEEKKSLIFANEEVRQVLLSYITLEGIGLMQLKSKTQYTLQIMLQQLAYLCEEKKIEMKTKSSGDIVFHLILH